ncbi:MAG: hypothetical protein J1E16_05550 [Muribaculaceae bacterium]|nr:hypothetical protein [Muribaculaceae bacterium]
MIENTTQRPMRRVIDELEVGQVCCFPISKMLVIRSCCSELSLMQGKKYTTSTNRENQTITVTRIS